MRQKKILILGCGAQGSLMAKELSQEPYISEIICGDIDINRARRLERESSKIRALKIDSSDIRQIAQAATGVDLIINALPCSLNPKVMRAALDAKINYQDLAASLLPDTSFVESVLVDLDKTDEWENAGLTALVHTGISPGLTNLLVRNAADELDVCEKVIILHYGSIKTKKFIPFWWSPEVALHDLMDERVIFENGKYKTLEPFSNEEEYPIPGIGLRKMYTHPHEEVVTLPRFIKGLKYVELKMGGGAPELAKMLYRFGLLSNKPIKVKETEVIPLDVVLALTPPAPSSAEEIKEIIEEGIEGEEGYSGIVIEGKKAGKKIKYVYKINSPGLEESFKKLGVSYTTYRTSISAVTFTKLFVQGKIKKKGLFPPECLDAEVRCEFLKEIAKKDITVTQIVESTL